MKRLGDAIVPLIVAIIMIPLTILVFVPAFQAIARTNRIEVVFEEVHDCEVTGITGGEGYYTIVWERNSEKFITFKMKDTGEEATLETTK